MIDTARLTAVLERPGAWSYAYVDGRGAEPQVVEERRRDAVARRLRDAGAPEPDVEAIETALDQTTGLAAPSSRYLLAEDGAIVIDEPVPGARVGPEIVGHSPIPPVLPLLRGRADGIRYLVVEVSRDAAEVRLENAGARAQQHSEIRGGLEALPKVNAGGWSQANYQRSAEETWKHNQSEIAAAVDRLVREYAPRFVVLSGDIRARQLLIDRLDAAARQVLIVVDAHTDAAGADSAALDRAIDDALAEHLHAVEERIDDDASADAGRSGARGLAAVTEALREARVARLLLDARMLDSDETLHALDRAPWIAAPGSRDADARVIDSIPAAEAMARAALLTGAEVAVAEDRYDDDDSPRSSRAPREPVASLRWPDP